ncbi:MAG TPA: hypothetical protein VMB85_06735 [Bryobacteraceae bacterium]|jgi:hypothetical protein|nr:hypothetical protein [Bryobacteraceae bacterium]
MAKRDSKPEYRVKPRSPSRDEKNGTVTVSLRIPIGMLKEIDEALKKRPYRMPRHLWLLEAIHEKLAALKNPRAGSTADKER